MHETLPRQLLTREETAWINPCRLPSASANPLCDLIIPDTALRDAEERLQRFAPFLRQVFPETAENNGLIESPLREIPVMRRKLADHAVIPGRLFLKMDSHLPIAGSVKARGGIYEVLKHAEDLALQAGLLSCSDDYTRLTGMRDFFGKYTIQVGSTGNLGMAIGIMGAALGFRVKIHMSADARPWKKNLLRSHGAEVLEYADDYSHAVAEGRKQSDADPMSYFVDDEKSVDLFLGYATAALRLQKQLTDVGITVDSAHPLLVYIPAGVGGAPGGITYGLKRLFGDNVHCFFAEPVTCPSVLAGMATHKHEALRVQDYGLSGKTEADGLACPSPSGFVTRLMTPMLSGIFTAADRNLYEYLRLLYKTEGIEIEPSACAGFTGPKNLLRHGESVNYCAANGLTGAVLKNAVHIVWATGGNLVPADIRKIYRVTYL